MKQPKTAKYTVKDFQRDFPTDDVCLEWLKRSIDGTHHHVSRKHLQKYVNEFAFRYNRRQSETPMFLSLLQQLTRACG